MASEKRKAYYKNWCEQNKDKLAIISKRYRESHKEQIKEKNRKYHLNNKIKVEEYRQEYIKRDPGSFKSKINKNFNKYYYSESGKKKSSCRNRTKWYLISKGILYKKRKCMVSGCSNKSDHVHHWSYDTHLDFSLLCKDHHLLIHNNDAYTLKNVKKFKIPSNDLNTSKLSSSL